MSEIVRLSLIHSSEEHIVMSVSVSKIPNHSERQRQVSTGRSVRQSSLPVSLVSESSHSAKPAQSKFSDDVMSQ